MLGSAMSALPRQSDAYNNRRGRERRMVSPFTMKSGV